MMEDTGFEIEDILNNLDKPKTVKTGHKGKRVERGLCKVLNDRFKNILESNPEWGQFNRSIGSGNRWGQSVNLSSSAKETFSGDVSCPTNFKFVIESKGGYNDIDLASAFQGGHREIDEFLKQVSADSVRSKREPLLVWKKDRKPRLAFLRMDLECDTFHMKYHYKDDVWTVVNLEWLLSRDDGFFFR